METVVSEVLCCHLELMMIAVRSGAAVESGEYHL